MTLTVAVALLSEMFYFVEVHYLSCLLWFCSLDGLPLEAQICHVYCVVLQCSDRLHLEAQICRVYSVVLQRSNRLCLEAQKVSVGPTPLPTVRGMSSELNIGGIQGRPYTQDTLANPEPAVSAIIPCLKETSSWRSVKIFPCL
jgi:hypothetical protein